MNRKLLQFFILSIVTAFSYNAAQGEDWKKIDNAGDAINKIIIFPNTPTKYAVASDLYSWSPDRLEPEFYIIEGKGFKITNDKGNSFGQPILDSLYVLDVMQIDAQNMIASCVNKTRGGIVKSTDGGVSWNKNEVDFNNTYFVTKFAKSNNKIFASAMNTAKGILVSEDNFDTFSADPQLSISSRDIQVSKLDANMIFVAGDNSYDGGVMRSIDGGNSWQSFDSGIEGLRIHTVLPSGMDKSIVYCGADSITSEGVSFGKGIYQSLDTGKTWHSVGASGAKIYDLDFHPLFPKFMVAAAGSQGIYVSANNGWWWEQNFIPIQEEYKAITVAAPAWDTTGAGAVFLVGTSEKGLYQSAPLRTDVNNNIIVSNRLEVTKLYPSPVADYFTINWNNPSSGRVSISISDLQGRKVANLIDSYFPAGVNEMDWSQANTLSPGSYLIVLQSEQETAILKFIKQ